MIRVTKYPRVVGKISRTSLILATPLFLDGH